MSIRASFTSVTPFLLFFLRYEAADGRGYEKKTGARRCAGIRKISVMECQRGDKGERDSGLVRCFQGFIVGGADHADIVLVEHIDE